MFKLEIKTDNAAFAPAEYRGDREGDNMPCFLECARILRIAAARLESGDEGGPLFDANGNKVGSFSLES